MHTFYICVHFIFRTGKHLGMEPMEEAMEGHYPEEPCRQPPSGRFNPDLFQQEGNFTPDPRNRDRTFIQRDEGDNYGGWKSFNRGGQFQDHWGGKGQNQGEGQFKVPKGYWGRPCQDQGEVPRGQAGHYRTHSDGRYDFRGEQNNNNCTVNNFQTDEFDINWNDNNFYGAGDKEWNPERFDRYGRDKRRGSFDTNFHGYNNYNQQQNNRWYGQAWGCNQRRGRGLHRGNREQRRSASQDNISPASSSSSDSSLKRRHENDDYSTPEKSRRRFNAPDFPAPRTSSPYLHTDVHEGQRPFPEGPKPLLEGLRPLHEGPRPLFEGPRPLLDGPRSLVDGPRPLLDDKFNQRPPSRSSSLDRLRDSGYGRSETESDSLQSGRKVTWSDQQVSSSSEKVSKKGNKKANKKNLNVVLPDSSSESEGKRKTGKGKNKKRNISPGGGLARKSKLPGAGPTKSIGDGGVSVLEKAEKLCKKLRSDREKANLKKKQEEKSKKIEKEQELNRKIQSLSERNKLNIKGILDSEVPEVFSDSKLEGSDSKTRDLSFSDNNIPSSESLILKTDGTVGVATSSERVQRAAPPRELKQSNIAERIAQTKADIDAIREKIESSVQKEMSQSGSSTDNVIPPKYPQATDRTSLVKMVNSPRTTKERLSLAQMLREHARSQTKLSLPRFNLKYSDLCSGSEKFDEFANINVEALAPDVQLQIANIIEADIKPDISELEKLLDQASEGDIQLDADVLCDLGLNSPNKSQVSETSKSHSEIYETLKSRKSPSGRSKSPALDQLYHSDVSSGNSGRHFNRLASPSPVSPEFPEPQRDMPPPKDLLGKTCSKQQYLDVPERDMPPPRGVLSLDELRSEKVKSTNARLLSSPQPTAANRFSSSLPLSSRSEKVPERPSSAAEKRLESLSPYSAKVTERQASGSEKSSISTLDLSSVIKQEKMDDDYNVALGYKRRSQQENSANKDSYNDTSLNDLGNTGVDETSEVIPSGRFSPVTRSKHTQVLYGVRSELPERDYNRKQLPAQVST